MRKYWMGDEGDLLTGYRSEWRDHFGSGRAMAAACVRDGRRPLDGHYRYADRLIWSPMRPFNESVTERCASTSDESPLTFARQTIDFHGCK